LCGQRCEPGEDGDDAGALEQSAEVDEPGRLAEPAPAKAMVVSMAMAEPAL
jgi:hypothetical protein